MANIKKYNTKNGQIYGTRLDLNKTVYEVLKEIDNNTNCVCFANWTKEEGKYVRIHVNNLNKDITFRPSRNGLWMKFNGTEKECIYDYDVRKHLLNIFNIAGRWVNEQKRLKAQENR